MLILQMLHESEMYTVHINKKLTAGRITPIGKAVVWIGCICNALVVTGLVDFINLNFIF